MGVIERGGCVVPLPENDMPGHGSIFLSTYNESKTVTNSKRHSVPFKVAVGRISTRTFV
jgi:hypothetical protein